MTNHDDLPPVGKENTSTRELEIFEALEEFMPCRFTPVPVPLAEEYTAELRKLGRALVSFYHAQNQLYFESLKGAAPAWIATYLDNGKPQEIIRLSRERAFRDQIPRIIRPDILLANGEMAICELDAVPGGFGLSARLADCYQQHGHQVLGDISIGEGFAKAMIGPDHGEGAVVAIIVSNESREYYAEMEWLAEMARDLGHNVYVSHPRDLSYTDEGAFLLKEHGPIQVDVVYRFMEMFDYQNISKWDLLMFLAKGKRVDLSPPPKPFLEEKMWFGLFHHPALSKLWGSKLSKEDLDYLRRMIPPTWIMDPSPVPPNALIPNLVVNGEPVQSWASLNNMTKTQRHLVIKPSGYSPEAWGGRGVVVGHDVNSQTWQKAIDKALHDFPGTTCVLQNFFKAERMNLRAFRQATPETEKLETRARLTPFFFVIDGEPVLSNVLITCCSSDKKKIHGMSDAIMSLCC